MHSSMQTKKHFEVLKTIYNMDFDKLKQLLKIQKWFSFLRLKFFIWSVTHQVHCITQLFMQQSFKHTVVLSSLINMIVYH